jgi:hypothetical protein
MELFTSELDTKLRHRCDVLSCDKPADSVLWSSPNDPEMFTCLGHGKTAVKLGELPKTWTRWTELPENKSN